MLGHADSNGGSLDRRSWATMGWVTSIVLAACLLTASGAINATDARQVLLEAAALVELGHVRPSLLSAEEVGDQVEWLGFGMETGHGLRNKYGFALHLFYVPAYALGRLGAWFGLGSPLSLANFLVSFVNPLATAASAGALVGALRSVGYSHRTSALTALFAVFGSFAWPLASVAYLDPVTMLWLTCATFCALRCRRNFSPGKAYLLGGLACIAILTKLALAAFLPWIGLLAVADATSVRSWRRWLLPIAVWVFITIALIGTVHYVRFGDPMVTGYENTAAFGSPFGGPLWYVLASPERGIIWFIPWAPIGLVGLFLARSRMPAVALHLLACAVVVVVLHASYYEPWGGYCLGPRYSLFLVVILAFGIAEILHRARSRGGRLALLLLGIGCVAWQAPMAVVAYFLPARIDQAVAHNGGEVRRRVMPLTTIDVLRHKTVRGPDELPLAAFSEREIPGSIRFDHWDNGGWQWWWIKPHPQLPAVLRFGAAGMAIALLVGSSRRLSKTLAAGEPGLSSETGRSE